MVVQAGDALGVEALRPAVDTHDADVEPLGHLALAETLVAQQHDAGPQAVSLEGRGRPHATFQLCAFLGEHVENLDGAGHGRTLRPWHHDFAVTLTRIGVRKGLRIDP